MLCLCCDGNGKVDKDCNPASRAIWPELFDCPECKGTGVSRDKGWKGWIEELADKITEETVRDNEPLDGDETELIGRLLWLELDLRQGNLTKEEYQERKALLERRKIW